MQNFDVIVIGAGLWGSAAARHLAAAGARVALVGPEEPAEKLAHAGVFASHYDAARITRQLDKDRDWSALAIGAIRRYGEVERKGGERFFHDTGALMVGPEAGPGADFVEAGQQVGTANGVSFERLDGAALRRLFPQFAFPEGCIALFEANGAGWVDPRAYARAAQAAAVADGLTLIRAEVRALDESPTEVAVTCADGTVLRAAKAVVAAGAWSRGLLPQPLPVKVYARTIAFFELDAAEQLRLKDTPSFTFMPPDGIGRPYFLPPVRYPDGKVYLKLGGDPVDVELTSEAEIGDWFRSGGNPEVGDFLSGMLFRLMPGLRAEVSYGACVTSFTGTGRPYVYRQTERVTSLTGGNGAGAKCADEVGRLGALLALGRPLDEEGYENGFGV